VDSHPLILVTSLLIISHRVLVSPNALPRFWIFMYRTTPLTYFISGIVSTGISGVEVQCTEKEILRFVSPDGQNCGAYLQDYINENGGRLLHHDTAQQCQFCPVSNTDSLIARIGIHYDDRWRNFAITLAYSAINIAGALFLYWCFRVPQAFRRKKAK